MVKAEVEKILQELFNKVRSDATSDRSVSDKDILLIKKEKDVLEDRASMLQSRLIKSNQRVNLLNREIAKRNENLRILAEAFRDQQAKSSSDDSMSKDMREALSQRDNTIRILKSTIEKHKKQAMNNNLYLESLYKKISENERQYNMAHIKDVKLKSEMDRLTDMLKAKDLAFIKNNEEVRCSIDNEKTRLKIKYEKEMEGIWQKERMLRSTIKKMDQQLMIKESVLKRQEAQLKRYIDIQDRIRHSIGAVSPMPAIEPMSTDSREEVQHPIPRTQKKEHAHSASSPKKHIADIFTNPKVMHHDIDEILPMVKVAMQHGDSESAIMNSMVSSGYDEKEVKKAIEKIRSKSTLS